MIEVVGYRLLIEVTMVVHFAFLGYVVAGGFIAWWRPIAFWPHVVLVLWGFATIVFGLNCPLTYVENWARQHAGMPVLKTGFVDHYLAGAVYPRGYSQVVLVLSATAITVSWVGSYVRWRRHRHLPITPTPSHPADTRPSGHPSR